MRLEKMAERVSANVKPLDDLIASAEAVLLTAVSRIVSWFASIPNMVMIMRSAQQTFGLGPAWSFAIALALELVSHSLVEHWQNAKHWNVTKRQSDQEMNERLALGMVVTFYILDFVMVGVLAFFTYQATGRADIFIALAYPLISVFVSIVTSERAHLFRLTQAAKMERQERQKIAAGKRQEKAAKTAEKRQNQAANLPSGTAENTAENAATFGGGNSAGLATRQKAAAILAERADISGAELGKMIGRSARLGRQLKSELMPLLTAETAEIGGNNHNGNGSKSAGSL